MSRQHILLVNDGIETIPVSVCVDLVIHDGPWVDHKTTAREQIYDYI
jgi:hypothetical protein